MTLLHRRLTKSDLNELVNDAPLAPVQLTDAHRASLSTRFRAVSVPGHRRLDAWSVERAGRSGDAFRWSPATARRVLGNASLRRMTTQPASVRDAVRDELGDQMLRAASGYSRCGSLSHWLASAPHPVIGLVSAEAVNWATQLQEIAEWLETPWVVAASDAYYDVASARTTLRARRDLIVHAGESRTVVRVRNGSPGKSAGPGLRADLTIEALADHDGVAPVRFIGLWPDAGVCLSVDGTMSDLRSGAKDLVRTAVVQRRRPTPLAA
ncbi:MAG: hypothetical protein ABSA07_05055 [Acidimicrobiales bacterium]